MTDDRNPTTLQHLDAYWRAANFLSVGQIFLWDNPLLKRPLTLADVKPMLLGHWGTGAPRQARTSSTRT
jgi:xylulose-5-phosphate/fructose-6-phosphate phosphoketolase